MSCDDNVCAECGRVCRDNPPRDWVAEECCETGDLVCVECCEKCPHYGGCEDTEGWEPPQRPWRTGMPAETIHTAPEERER